MGGDEKEIRNLDLFSVLSFSYEATMNEMNRNYIFVAS